MLKVFVALCALNGCGGLFVVLLAAGNYLLYAITGIEIIPSRSHQPANLDGVLAVIGMSLFWLLEVFAFWIVWFRLSRLAIYVAVGLLAFWIVAITDIVLIEVLETGAAIGHLPIGITMLAVVCWPSIALARWLSHRLLLPPVLRAIRSSSGSAPPF
jgi:hypothetical protein